MNIKRLSLGFAGLVTVIVAAEPLEGCKEMTPQQESALVKASSAILCAMEGEMLDDPTLNKVCEEILPSLAPAQREAVQAHIAARKARASKPFVTDGGVSEGGVK